jgi:uncharacterized membrane protein
MTAGDWILTLLLSAAPVAELRGGLPYALAQGAAPALAFAAAVGANLAVIPFLLLILARLDRFLRRWRWTSRAATWVLTRTRRRGRIVERLGPLGLVILVAIPLPGTGAWTGCLVAFLLGIPMKKALPRIAVGVVIAGVLVLLAGLGVLRLFGAG